MWKDITELELLAQKFSLTCAHAGAINKVYYLTNKLHFKPAILQFYFAKFSKLLIIGVEMDISRIE